MKQKALLRRIMEGIERLSPSDAKIPDLSRYHSFIWKLTPFRLEPVDGIKSLNPNLLVGIDEVKKTLINNTKKQIHQTL